MPWAGPGQAEDGLRVGNRMGSGGVPDVPGWALCEAEYGSVSCPWLGSGDVPDVPGWALVVSLMSLMSLGGLWWFQELQQQLLPRAQPSPSPAAAGASRS